MPQKYFDTYYKNTEDYVASVDGVLSRKKNTEYSRAVLALTAIGKTADAFLLLLWPRTKPTAVYSNEVIL